jgi:DNA-binding response OmpR family regulator
MATILLVEDEEKLRDNVQQFLSNEGFSVVAVDSGLEAVRQIRMEEIDVVILDVMLPELNGIQVCQIVRQTDDVPILIVSALGTEEDVLAGLEKGADDYIIKPFRMRELVARVRAILRRRQPARSADKIIYYKELILDLDRVSLFKNGTDISLTPTEFKLLALMAGQPGRAFTRLQLLEGALGEAYENYERVIDTHIFNLRRKLESHPGKPEYIQTVFGVGYRFGDKL